MITHTVYYAIESSIDGRGADQAKIPLLTIEAAEAVAKTFGAWGRVAGPYTEIVYESVEDYLAHTQEKIREAALAKLSAAERLVLGV